MRYYRMWIYTCNAVLLLGVVAFAAAAGSVLGDNRTRFVPVPAYHPTLVYAYLALVAQGGLLQAVGCYGALRLNERWLNIYWLLMLLLLVGDVLVGVVWIFLFGSITQQLPGELWARLRDDYGRDTRYTAAWDELQEQMRCCGVQGPRDYDDTRWGAAAAKARVNDTEGRVAFLPASCIHTGSGVNDDGDGTASSSAPVTTPFATSDTSSSTSSTGAPYLSDTSADWTRTGGGRTETGSSPPSPPPPSSSRRPPDDVSRQGCARLLQEWLQHCADVLFVLGYCVIAFLKLCFLGILRYEIKEMIQKIKMLNQAQEAQPELTVLGDNSSSNGCNGTATVPDRCGGDGLKEALLRGNHSYDNGTDPAKNHLLDKKSVVRSNGNNNDLELSELNNRHLSS